MKKIIFIILISLLCTEFSFGQDKQEGRIEAEKIAFFTRRLDLTPDEAREFWPVYNDFLSRKNKIRQEKNALMRYVNQNFKNLDDKELEESGDKIVAFLIEEAELTRTYHEKFKEVLPAIKVIRVYQTETQFNRILLEQLSNKRSQQQSGRRREQF